MGLNRILFKSYLRIEDFLRTKNLAGIRSSLKMVLSPFYRNDYKRLEVYEQYLVNFRNTRFKKIIIRHALRIAQQYAGDTPSGSEDSKLIRHAGIIKPSRGVQERGILLVSFENELLKIVSSPSFPQIEENYQIVFIPSWQPFYSAPLFLLAAKAKYDYFIMPSSLSDMPLCKEMGDTCVTIPFHAASWVNEDFYPEQDVQKDVDLVMIANFSKYKRHWRLFEALKELPKNLTVCLAGVPLRSRTKQSLLKEAEAFGVQDRIRILEGLEDHEIKNLLARSKIFCALSHKEGSYIAVAESLMAGTPVGMYKNALIGTRSYINSETGVFFEPSTPLAPQLITFIDISKNMNPSKWARANISAGKNNEKLNRILQEHALSNGHEWSVDLEPFYSKRFDFYYYREKEAETEYEKEFENFEEKYCLVIERPHYQ